MNTSVLIHNKVLDNNSFHNCDIDIKHIKKPVIECKNPVFIVHPSLPELISKYGHYYFHGQHFYEKSKWRLLYHINLSPFKSYLENIDSSNYLDNVVIDDSTGEFYPIYLCVPCGKCLLCREKKVNSFVNRIKYESFCYPFKPYFFTLTYNDKSLPKDGVSVRDCQLFLKRFRQRLIRSGITERCRYVLVSEYGTKSTHRPHYHGIFFGLPLRTDSDCRRIERILGESWSNGFVMGREVDMCDTATAYYTSKYMRKYKDPPTGCKPVFQLSSRRHGGIGSAFFFKQSKMLHKRVQREFNVLNPWTGKSEVFKWSSYSLDKIYPSVSKSVPLELRKALKEYCLSFSFWKHYQPELLWLFETNYRRFKAKFKDILYLPFDTLSMSDMPLLDKDIHMGNIYECERIILKYIDRDFSNCKKVESMRKKLLDDINLDSCEIDLVQKLSKIKRNIKRLEKLEKI